MRRSLITNVSPTSGSGTLVIKPAQDQPWRLVSLQFALVTGAAVANRLVEITLSDQSQSVAFLTGFPTAQAASLAQFYAVSPAYGQQTQFQTNSGPGTGQSWPDFWVPSLWVIGVNVQAFQAGDSLAAVSFWAEYGEAVFEHDQELAAYTAAVQALSS